MLSIDGSMDEGGGQILRSALAMSLCLKQPFRIFNIRAARKKPGLRPQHLVAVNAAATVSKATVSGATLGAQQLEFLSHAASNPGAIILISELLAVLRWYYKRFCLHC